MNEEALIDAFDRVLGERNRAQAEVVELARAIRAWWLADGATEEELFRILARYE